MESHEDKIEKFLSFPEKKHVKLWLLHTLGLKDREVAALTGTNRGHVGNVVRDYKKHPEKIASAEKLLDAGDKFAIVELGKQIGEKKEEMPKPTKNVAAGIPEKKAPSFDFYTTRKVADGTKDRDDALEIYKTGARDFGSLNYRRALLNMTIGERLNELASVKKWTKSDSLKVKSAQQFYGRHDKMLATIAKLEKEYIGTSELRWGNKKLMVDPDGKLYVDNIIVQVEQSSGFVKYGGGGRGLSTGALYPGDYFKGQLQGIIYVHAAKHLTAMVSEGKSPKEMDEFMINKRTAVSGTPGSVPWNALKQHLGLQTYQAGGILVGNSHDNGGIDIKTPTGVVEMEGDEIILTKGVARSGEKVEFEGKKMTKCEAASKLNESEGGIKIPCEGGCGTEGEKAEKGAKIGTAAEGTKITTHYEEAIRYIDNAEEMLAKSPNDGKDYLDKKYVKSAAGTAYAGVELAAKWYIKLRGLTIKGDSADRVKEALSKIDKKILNSFSFLYEVMHKSIYYGGMSRMSIVDESMKDARHFVSYLKPFNKEAIYKDGGRAGDKVLQNYTDGTPYRVVGQVARAGEIGIDFGNSPGSLPLLEFPAGGMGYFHPSDLLRVTHEDFAEYWGVDQDEDDDDDEDEDLKLAGGGHISTDHVIFTIDDGDLDSIFLSRFDSGLDYLIVGQDTFYKLPRKEYDRFIDYTTSSGLDPIVTEYNETGNAIVKKAH
ncbi:MAG: hypothetical protein UV51_C0016G0005 [Candidatus Woesebacteria bacterium GW2011_GWC1_42_9]|nr:MAG: hypothetical protein UV51_C0016G0005 [Candidatus Woesebacteria bacterium GW2011_GWC1_42_9]